MIQRTIEMVVELLRPTDVVKVKKPLEIQIISMAVSGLYTVLKCGPKNIWNQKNRKIGKICELRLMIPILAWARLELDKAGYKLSKFKLW